MPVFQVEKMPIRLKKQLNAIPFQRGAQGDNNYVIN